MSPILLLIAIDWVMRKTTANKPRGIHWFSHLEDLDFADDLAVLSSKYIHLQEKTGRLDKTNRLVHAKFDGWDTSSEWTRIKFQSPDGDGHQSEKGNEADLKQPGG